MTEPTRRGPRFDTTINLGHVLTIIALLAGGFGAFSAVREAVSSLDTRIAAIENARLPAVEDQVRELTANVVPAVAVNATNIAQLQALLGEQLALNREIQGALTNIARELGTLGARIETRSSTPPF